MARNITIEADNSPSSSLEDLFSVSASVSGIEAREGSIEIPSGDFLFNAEFSRTGSDLVLTGADGQSIVVIDYFGLAAPASLKSPAGAVLTADLVETLVGPRAPGQYAQAAAPSGNLKLIGVVETISGSATATRSDGTVVSLKQGDAV